VLRLPAEVDVSNADQIREDLLAVLAQDADMMIADMGQTTFCDSAGVTALVQVYKRANAAGATLRLVVRTPAVQRVLTLTGVSQLISMYPSVAACLGEKPDPDERPPVVTRPDS
jgi:anti-sigma B factor antagonist